MKSGNSASEFNWNLVLELCRVMLDEIGLLNEVHFEVRGI